MPTKNKLIDFIYAAIFAAATAAMGFIIIPLPFSPVPITGQNLAIMLAASILTMRQAALSVMTFLLLGAIGLPVFTGGTGGIGVLFGPRGGYLIGFLIGAIVTAKLKGTNNNTGRLAMANLIGGIFVVYILGVAWLNFVTAMGLQRSLMVGALPFIPGDLLKVGIATIIGTAINKRLQNASVQS
ncbi:biotin transport system substrate-specific component [Sporomusaceae bacterium BoRhaA]|uniref:biotin transporter BioY n=1 Tax=Pelorhabdus rhamnosifermentans TaxID=2772457 RepID=UPI001C062A1F|nr:biotin transporter BioY [Pelorhabdus rhamnosifermentans]MBU2701813.1 biotin transport system substrate-specific component [Pelorhabdus rhamnosifermentans]